MDLALFDFDGTITDKDMYSDFIRFAADRRRLMVGKVLLAPVILAYKAGLLSDSKARTIVSGFAFRGRTAVDLDGMGAAYASDIIPNHLRTIAMDRLRWHRQRGDSVVVVSASLDLYLKHWCGAHGLKLICTEVERCNGVITGRYVDGDCSGREKARRILQCHNLADYQTIYAYGDTTEDREMLQLASVRYMGWERVVG